MWENLWHWSKWNINAGGHINLLYMLVFVRYFYCQIFVLCALQVGERFPAPIQNLRALGGNLHPLRSVWTMGRLLGANLLGAVEDGETATQTTMAGATQQWHLHLANLVYSFSLYGLYEIISIKIVHLERIMVPHVCSAAEKKFSCHLLMNQMDSNF